MSESKRSFYRINYPTGDRPSLAIFGMQMPVVNLSEEGVLVESGAQGAAFAPGDQLAGTILLASGKNLTIRGTVLRHAAGTMAIRLIDGIPLPVIMEEQRLLLQKYKTLDTQS